MKPILDVLKAILSGPAPQPVRIPIPVKVRR